ncbi:MAG: hypothetical protein ACKVOP_14430 [Sphingomonadaceae bacterium]
MGADEIMRSAFNWKRPQLLAMACTLVAMVDRGLAQMPSAVPPPIEQASANCVRPQYASDTLVCEDPALRALDADVARLGRIEPRLAVGAIWESQFAWFRRRAQCAFQADHRDCLVAAYTDRRAVLEATALTGERPLRCEGPWRGRPLVVTTATAGNPLKIAENGLLVAVASAGTKNWKSWIGFRASGPRLVLELRTGSKVRCGIG